MPRPLLALLAVLLLVGGLFWIVFAGGAAPASLPDAPGATAEAALGSGASAALESARETDPGETGAPTAAPALERQELATDAALDEGLELFVVDEEGRPLPDAEVYAFVERMDWSGLDGKEVDRYQRDRKLLFRERAQRFPVDADGRVVVPDSGGRPQVAGWTEGRFGALSMRQLRSRQEGVPLELLLAREAHIKVRVLDQDGEPAEGVMVTMVAQEKVGSARRYPLGVTDAAGLCEQLHFQVRDWVHGPVELRAGLFGGGDKGVEVDLDDLPDEEIVLRMGPTGSLLVRVLEADGTPLDVSDINRRRVTVASFVGEPDGRDSWNRDFQEGRPLEPDATLRLHHVPLGRTFSLYFHNVTTSHLFVKGPTAGERDAERELRLDPDRMQISGRLLDVDGRPVAANNVAYTLANDGRTWSSGSFRTDDKGAFLQLLRSSRFKPGVTIRAELHSEGLDDVLGVIAERTLKAGVTDLGALRMVPAPVLVAGRFVSSEPMRERLGLVLERRDPRGEWVQMWQYQQSYDNRDHSRFAFFGTVHEQGPYRLAMQSRTGQNSRMLFDPIPFTPGDDRLVVDLRRGGEVTALFQVDANTPWRSLIYRLEPTVDSRSTEEQRNAEYQRHQRGGYYLQQQSSDRVRRTWRSLAAGEYQLSVVAPGRETPLVQLAGLRVPDGGPCDDPRLETIDLAARIGVVSIHLRDEHGEPIAATNGKIALAEGDGMNWQGFSFDRNPVPVPLARGDAVDLLVAVPGYRRARVEGLRADREITLRKAPVLGLLLELPALPDGVQLRAALQREGLGGQRVYDERGSGPFSRRFDRPVVQAVVPGTQRFDLPVPEDGRYRLILDLVRGNEPPARLGCEPSILELRGAALGVQQVLLSERSRQELEALGGR